MKKAISVLSLMMLVLLLPGCLNTGGLRAVIHTDPSPPEGMPPLTVQFDGSDSYGGDIEVFEWLFIDPLGGEEVELGQIVERTFEEGGQYRVALTVYSADGKSDTARKLVAVGARPRADIVIQGEGPAGDSEFYVGASIKFDGSASIDAAQWLWEFSDGEMRQGRIVNRTFYSRGAYTVTLTVENEEGARSLPVERSFEVVTRPCCGQ